MKNIKLLAGLFLLITTFVSCDVEPIDNAIDLGDFGNPASGPAVFKADFSGATWTATTSQAIISGNNIQLVGAKANGENFAFLLEGSAIGTYPANANFVTFNPANSTYGYWSVNTANATENTGSVIITNINTVAKTISGTFSFKGYWSDTDNTSIIPVQFTNGVFTNIPYINQVETGDTFFAKVGGVEFVDTDILTAETSVGLQNWLSIAAQDASMNAINVAVHSDVIQGNTYPITGNVGVDKAQGTYTLSDVDYPSVSGSVTIVSKTATHIKGTFSFVGANGTTTKSITDGAFDVEY